MAPDSFLFLREPSTAMPVEAANHNTNYWRMRARRAEAETRRLRDVIDFGKLLLKIATRR